MCKSTVKHLPWTRFPSLSNNANRPLCKCSTCVIKGLCVKSHVLYTFSREEITRNQGNRVLKIRFFQKRCCCSSNAFP